MYRQVTVREKKKIDLYRYIAKRGKTQSNFLALDVTFQYTAVL